MRGEERKKGGREGGKGRGTQTPTDTLVFDSSFFLGHPPSEDQRAPQPGTGTETQTQTARGADIAEEGEGWW